MTSEAVLLDMWSNGCKVQCHTLKHTNIHKHSHKYILKTKFLSCFIAAKWAMARLFIMPDEEKHAQCRSHVALEGMRPLRLAPKRGARVLEKGWLLKCIWWNLPCLHFKADAIGCICWWQMVNSRSQWELTGYTQVSQSYRGFHTPSLPKKFVSLLHI